MGAALVGLAPAWGCGGQVAPPPDVVLICVERLTAAEATALAQELRGAAFTRLWVPSPDPRVAELALLRAAYPDAGPEALTLDVVLSGHGYGTSCFTDLERLPDRTSFDFGQAALHDGAVAHRVLEHARRSERRPRFVYAHLTTGVALLRDLRAAAGRELLVALVGLAGGDEAPERTAAVLLGEDLPAGMLSDEDRTLLELMPTLLRAAGLPRSPLLGAGLFELHGGGPLAEIYTFAPDEASLIADGRWRLYVPTDGSAPRFYDLAIDPGESVSVDDETKLAELLARFDARTWGR